jgi:DNA-binding NtrC family response regulator
MHAPHTNIASLINDPLVRSAPKNLTRVDVVIVEDERISRQALNSLLSSIGYHPAAYGTAEEALAHIERDAPRIVLVDVDLPGMSGLDLIDQMERLAPQTLAVLLTAASGDRIDRFRCRHPVPYLRKPVDFKRLIQLLPHSTDALAH